MDLMAVALTDHSPDRVFVGSARLVAHRCRLSHPGYPRKYLGSVWVQPIADIGPLSARFCYNFLYSSDGDQLSDAPLPMPQQYIAPYTMGDDGEFRGSDLEEGRVQIDEMRMAVLYGSLKDAIDHQQRLNAWLKERGHNPMQVTLAANDGT